MEFCFHDDFDITAASVANDIVARGDNVLLAEFKERLLLLMCYRISPLQVRKKLYNSSLCITVAVL